MSNLQQGGQLSEHTSLPDGTTTSQTLSPDPRWGLQAATPTSGTVTLGNLGMTTSGSRVTNLSNPGDPFSMISETDTSVINGRSYTSTFTTSNRTEVNTTPVGRILTTVLDTPEWPIRRNWAR